ncbi:reverse transcriptase [Senna tora]|uniref:Reverse transcriptase n=1 Tax=Senna tora TaxID=362788 RepID=A0A834SWA1_9FABA|nr:reverse transcriptase [Senna tora]
MMPFARNVSIFNNNIPSPVIIAKKSIASAVEFFHVAAAELIPPLVQPYILNVKWNPPNFGWWKLNCDGACSGNPGPFAIGGIIRDHMGNWVKGFSGYVGHGLPFGDLVKLKCPTPSEKETSVLIFLLNVPF